MSTVPESDFGPGRGTAGGGGASGAVLEERDFIRRSALGGWVHESCPDAEK